MTIWRSAAHFSGGRCLFSPPPTSEVSFLEQVTLCFSSSAHTPNNTRAHRLTVFHNEPVYLAREKSSDANSSRHLASCFAEWNLRTAALRRQQGIQERFKLSLELAQLIGTKKMGICGFLTVTGKCLVVLGLKLLFLVPAGVPIRSGDSVSKDNITVRQGDSAVLK